MTLLAGTAALAANAPTVVVVGASNGARLIPRGADAQWEASEDVAILYDEPIDKASFGSALTIDPAAPYSLYMRDYGKRVEITFRKVAGTTYHVHVAPGVRTARGDASAAPFEVTVHVTAPPLPSPLRATPNEPYRYGVLAHPFPFSLGGPNAQRLVDLYAQAGVRFVRIDYCGTQVEPHQSVFDWSTSDRIASMLAAKGITELPIVEQYCAPTWATAGRGYPAIWSDPSSYAQFAEAVARHVAERYPQITRVELFNEPNLHGWWDNKTDPRYAASDGSATAAYMRAAYEAIKRAAPQLSVVGPALADGGRMVDPRKFLETMYASACRRGACWDILSVHTYRWKNPTFTAPQGAPNRFDIYKSLQKIAADHGDPDTHVMITEWGYSTDPKSPYGVDPQTQARYVALGFNEILRDRSVDGIVYVNMSNPSDDFWGNTALVWPDLTPKPAFSVYQEFARAAHPGASTTP